MQPIATIQYLRAAAALMVVIGHAQSDVAVSAGKAGSVFPAFHLLPWGAGVDLFFVISGFIMVHASERLFARPGGSWAFIRRRLIRIVPLYWIMAAAFLLTMAAHNHAIGKPLLAISEIVKSFLFIPSDTYGNGVLQPFFTLGWTLNYEMLFYAAFSFALLLPRTLAVWLLGTAMVSAVGLGAALAPSSPMLSFWSQPIILEFVAGMLIAQAFRSGLALSAPIRAILFIAAMTLLWRDFLGSATQPTDWIASNGGLRVVAWGLPAALMVAAAVWCAPQPRGGWLSRAGQLLGDASYALYLSHPFAIILARKAMLATGLFGALRGWETVALSIIAAIMVAIAVHLLFERPLTRALSQRFAAPDAARPALSAQPA